MLGSFFDSFFSQSSGTVWIAFFLGLVFGGAIVFWALFKKREIEEAEDAADEAEKETHSIEHPTYSKEVL